MITKRIIACLDVKDGRTVKGVQFEDLRDAGDAVELGALYSRLGIDELVFLDITATLEGRKTFMSLVSRVAREIQIPFTVGGGIKDIADVEKLLRCGADKVSINSAALERPQLITEVANEFGSQCLVVAIDAKRVNQQVKVFKNSGKVETGYNLQDWVKKAAELGAGEILLTSIEHDGSEKGFDCELTSLCASLVNLPIIASGGAGEYSDFLEVLTTGKADAALAAGVFHFGKLSVSDLKKYLNQNFVEVRTDFLEANPD